MRRTTVTVTAHTLLWLPTCRLRTSSPSEAIICGARFANVRKGPRGSPGPNFTNQNDRNQKQGRCQWEDSEVEAGSAPVDELGSSAVQGVSQPINLCHQ